MPEQPDVPSGAEAASTPAAAPPPISELLVPFDGSGAAEKLLRCACRAALADGAALTVLCVVGIPAGAAPDELPLSQDDPALEALTRAQAICRAEGVTAAFELSHARDLADAILAEARRSGAALVCLSLDERQDGQPGDGETALMSRTVQSVLAAAPCSVLLNDPSVDVPERPWPHHRAKPAGPN